MHPVLILLGPNLNMLGRREPDLYGSQTMEEIEAMCRAHAAQLGREIEFRQSNHEGELVTWIQDALDEVSGIIINPAAYTHTSIAIHDALKMHNVPVVEVHHSDPEAREAFRHTSYVAPLAAKTIKGKGPQGYIEALDFLASTAEIAQ
jgi:3-dehydroquinate dehydratase-2